MQEELLMVGYGGIVAIISIHTFLSCIIKQLSDCCI
jgi:hypothetical protein